MQNKYNALVANDTWELVPLPTNQKAIGCKWVFRMKLFNSWLLDNYKSMIIALSYLQEIGADFYEIFNPIIKHVTIWVVLSLALHFEWELRQVDVNNSFLNGDLEEVVYMKQPTGFEKGSEWFARLKRPSVGLNNPFKHGITNWAIFCYLVVSFNPNQMLVSSSRSNNLLFF